MIFYFCMKNIQFTGFVFIFNSEFCSSQFQSSQIYYSIISQERKYLYRKKYDSQEDIAGAEKNKKKKKLHLFCFQLTMFSSFYFLSFLQKECEISLHRAIFSKLTKWTIMAITCSTSTECSMQMTVCQTLH